VKIKSPLHGLHSIRDCTRNDSYFISDRSSLFPANSLSAFQLFPYVYNVLELIINEPFAKNPRVFHEIAIFREERSENRLNLLTRCAQRSRRASASTPHLHRARKKTLLIEPGWPTGRGGNSASISARSNIRNGEIRGIGADTPDSPQFRRVMEGSDDGS